MPFYSEPIVEESEGGCAWIGLLLFQIISIWAFISLGNIEDSGKAVVSYVPKLFSLFIQCFSFCSPLPYDSLSTSTIQPTDFHLRRLEILS